VYQLHGKRLRHLDVLNALKLIKGDVRLDLQTLMFDLDQVKDDARLPDARIAVNTGTPVVVFI
jgi:hypothetical protein